jgi:AraC-like DNA-binding protein/ligand-binding sensor protein
MAQLSIDDLKDLRILEQLCEIYYQNTGMVVSIHHPGRNGRVDFYPQEQRSQFCRLVQSSVRGRELCLSCDREGLNTARRKSSYHIYRCHAGLVDVAIPLDYKGTEIGSIYTGQVLLEVPTKRRFRQVFRALEPLGLESPALEEAFLGVKVVERSRLVFFAKLLHLLGNYIIMAENELYLQKTIVLKDRELHRNELEKVKLEKTLKELTISVLESGGQHQQAEGRGSADNGSYVVSKAQLFIRANHGKDIRLEDVARAVYLSPNYFSSLFKRVTGSSFRSYLVRKRIEAAQVLLEESDLPIKEIVCRVGFKDYNYFNRTFAALAGATPARHRELHRARVPNSETEPVLPGRYGGPEGGTS